MTSIVLFDNEKELSELTGLNHTQLWDNGFNLDDWDWGFVSDTEYSRRDIEETPPSIDFILTRMEDYYCGMEHTEYRGKHYYMVYHS